MPDFRVKITPSGGSPGPLDYIIGLCTMAGLLGGLGYWAGGAFSESFATAGAIVGALVGGVFAIKTMGS